MARSRVLTGLDVLVRQDFAPLKGKRVGAIVNPTSVDSEFRHLADLLHSAKDVTLAALFGPEHGVRGEAQYMVAVDDDPRDRRTGVPVYSLYGHTYESLSPRAEWLKDLDVLVFDVQDVGSRYYTYVYTMALAMRAAARAKIPFIVLDCPNPLGGVRMEGNLVGDPYRSFVGLYPLPNRHGMTAGELAQHFNRTEKMGCELSVIRCEGLKREHAWSDTGLPFINPSPNMPTTDTALVYPGMCLLEGTNISEGRGTCRPFEQFGAPWMNVDAMMAELERSALPGVRFRPIGFTPTFDKIRGVSCNGLFIHVTDPATFLPLRTGVAIVRAARLTGEGEFSWRADAYEFVEDIPAFDLLCGADQVRLGIDSGAPLDVLFEGFEAQTERFGRERTQDLLYP